MKTYKSILIAIFCTVLLSPAVKAQTNVVFQESKNNALLFTNSSTISTASNYIIKKIAEGNNKNPQRTEFNLNFKQNLRITRSGNENTITVDLNTFDPTGDIFYRGFSLSNEIIPSSLDFKIDVLDKNNVILKKFVYTKVNINGREAQLVEEKMVDTLNRELKLSIHSFSCNYNESKFDKFDLKVAAINNYYASDVVLANAVQQLMYVNPMDVDNLQQHQANLLNVENMIFDINSKKIPETLPLQDFDPIQFNLKITSLQNQASAKRNAISVTLATLHEIYYNRGLEAIVNNQTLIAQKWFNRSLEVNPMFAPSMLQMAKIDFANGNLDDAAARIKDIFIKMNPDPQTQQFSGELSSKISSQYTAIGAEQNDKGSYIQALNTLQKSKSLCESIPGLVCSENLQLNISRAKNGIYSGILKEASAALAAGKIAIAENKVNEAYFYQKENSKEIISVADADAIMQQIKQIEYNKIITDAKLELKNKNFSKSLQYFDNAYILQTTYSLKQDASFIKQRAEAAKPVLLSKTDKAIDYANANNLNRAKQEGKEIETQQVNYVLDNDKDINAKLDNLQAIIFKQECANAQKEIDTWYTQAKQAVQDKAFIKADELFANAEEIMNNYPMCKFSNVKLKDEHVEILPGATYQKLLLQVLEMQDSYRYKEAIDKYIAAEKYFYGLEVDKLALVHLSLYDFVSKKGNVKWQQYTAQYFLDKNDLKNSLAMCQFLIGKNVSPKKIKYTLYDLGKAYAAIDKKANPSAKAKVEVLKYTNGDKKMKFFKKGYLKSF